MTLAILILMPLAAACGVAILGKRNKTARDMLVRAVCFAELLTALIQLYVFSHGGEKIYAIPYICGFGMTFRLDGFRCLYVTVAAFMWAMTGLFSHKYFAHYHNRTRYYFFNLLTLCGVMGMFLSDDLYTAFIFFEIMSMASYPWVAHDETEPALRAAATYLGIAVLGGMVTLMGMFLMYRCVGSLAFDAIRKCEGSGALYTAAALTLFGFMAKAGAYPVHVWLPKAHPVAPAPASALLSGMLTKAGLFGVLFVSFGIFGESYVYGCVMLAIALVTMTSGAVLGVFSNNLKRTLACSSMSQIGYILTGVAAAVLLGEEGALAAQGAVSHMVNHSVLKLTLFMAAGAVYMNIHKLELNDIQGFGRNKPLLHCVYILGALGLAGVPGFNGYISKTMIHEGLVEWKELSGNFVFSVSEWVFLFAAGLTTAYMLKTYIVLFWQKNRDPELQAKYDGMSKSYLDARSRIALILSALLIPAIGLLPDIFVKYECSISLPFVGLEHFHQIEYFSFENLKGGAITLVIGTLVYLFVVRRWMYSKETGYIERWPEKLDIENGFYRPALNAMVSVICFVAGILGVSADKAAVVIRDFICFAARVCEVSTDTAAVVVRDFVFTDNRGKTDSPAKLKRASGRTQVFLSKLKPVVHPDPREVSDLSYGNYLTNTVSFGLIICTMGIVAALIYALLK